MEREKMEMELKMQHMAGRLEEMTKEKDKISEQLLE
jgi:hypothetical protein